MADWPYNTTAWQKLRKAKLEADPLCHPCSLRGVLTPANTVDHVKAIADGGMPFPPLDGLMSMCPPCHSVKTRAVDHPRSAPGSRKFKGFDANGNPVDPDDEWHARR